MPIIVESDPEVKEDISKIYRHRVVLYNDDINSFDHVIECVMTICGKNEEEAFKITLEAHEKGKSVCFDGSIEACETVAEKMGIENLTVSLH
ncbi:MAG TPA: ATP-dependent Clp protease adaptor ClpS [Leptospiraceae bacterium]|nr:ATP-dependent Clp protease adaptor ClpS [Leptospiraceae bacterium]HMY65589.1 ATP-dependent Clp protease adaptor ClpS [Leptospiraceae bacterium]HMZ60287.1 ATP-dependent Clp protease adaptor ClpS [Leptospiraceae bacterium]HNF16068.1 ATP-dependent Clp protease adaptor ClpS [Leptospiraceae bacterium]HNF25977.1 ATP-dependent Clp protease adaptor ClpS [Leptospiraceae bacterium]